MQLTGVLHVHSNYSYDCTLALSELKAFFVKQDVQFACMTEHTDELTPEAARAFVRECAELSDESFVFVPGFEVPYQEAHVLHIGATEFVCQFADETSLQHWRTVTPLVVLAHPVRNHFTVDATLRGVIDGVEIWNQQYEGKRVPRARSVDLLKKLRASGPCLATGGIDLHRREHFGQPMTTVTVTENSGAAIVAALKAGSYTFGSVAHQYDASPDITLTSHERWQSHCSVAIIVAGKWVNKVLAACGVSLPKSLKQMIRTRV